MKKTLFTLFIFFFTGDSILEFSPEYILSIVHAPSEIGGKEDISGRNQYLQMLTADPSTGLIPPNIRKAEILFDRKHSINSARLPTQNLLMESAGPTNVGGRTRAVAFDVRDENVILAGGVSGGVWKSIDGGDSWSRKSNPENRNSVTCIVQDTRPGREDTWYHGTGELTGNSASGGGAASFRGDGIYKSTDNGESWEALTSTQDSDPNVFNSQFQYIWDIEINPANLSQDEVLIAAFGGILRSLDGGNTWDVVLGRRLFDLDESIDLNSSNASFYTGLERSVDNVFYATLSTETPIGDTISAPPPQSGFHYSLDGENWSDITPLTPSSRYRRTVIGSSPSNPDVTYFMVDSSPIFILEHRLSLTNSQGRVKGFDPEPRVIPEFNDELGNLDTQGSYNMTVRVHPSDENIVFVGGTNLFRSTDGFRTIEAIKWIGGYNPGGGNGVYPNHHPDQHDLIFLPSNPNVAISASDGGLRKSNDITADSVIWESSNNGFITSQFFTVAQSKQVGNPSIIGGMQDNGTDLTTTGSGSWTGIIGGDGSYAATTNDDALWFASFQEGQLLRLTLNDNLSLSSFGRVDPGGLVSEAGSLYLFINPFVLDPTNQNRMFCAGGNHLYFHPNVSQIRGGSQVPTSFGWQKVNKNPLTTSGRVSAVEASFNGQRVYFGTSGGSVYRIDNAENELNFELDDITTGIFPENAYVSCIAVNPDDNQHLLVIFSNYNVPSIFESTDGGDSFINISGDLEENADGSGSGPSVRWAEIIPTNTGNLYLVGTSTGLYSSEFTSSNTIWLKEAVNDIGSAVVTMMDYRPGDGRLVVASHGNGVFHSNIPDFKTPSSENQELPFEVIAAYPNPFSIDTQIQYSIPEDGDVRVDILSADGSLIHTILWGPQFAGTNTVYWDGNSLYGTTLVNGIYFYRIQYKGQSKSGRLLLRR